MQENYQLALQLLIVGMFSVFFILGIVVALGKILVLGVNKFSPDVTSSGLPKVKSLENKKVAVITSAVNLITQGKGVIRSIKKL
ncbi:MAG: oxaloacetate decarboxylase [Saprospiraceae bacterium]|nr:oxaloacetate decarboxylase [Bacteroidia bacterium]NNE13839.1 oxaloacetate decarboxylase [Saprospiraceae bacterium]NNL93343.1 oxaloacetate decarboxylase [Saprospiraceae bacterium]